MDELKQINIGNTKIIALKDGELNLPKEVLVNLEEETAEMVDSNDDLTLSNINAFLIQQEDKNLLVDAGCRDLFGPSCGFILDELSKINVKPEDITDIFFTHLHPDHIGGAISSDGTPIFSNASIRILSKEIDFWQKNNFEDIEVNGKNFADLANTVITAYGEKVLSIGSNEEIIKNVHTVALPGHTPGHAGFRVDEANNSFMHLGDILHTPNLQLPNPKVSLVFDVDMEEGLKTRTKLFDMVSNDKILCTGGHMLMPKFGYIEKSGLGYRFSG